MPGREPEPGPTARTVAANVQRLREALHMNYTQLSKRLREVEPSRPISAVGVRRIEAGERRVTPDDLVTLAQAFRVSPTTLLMPDTDRPDEMVEVTGADRLIHARHWWNWLKTNIPLPSYGISAPRFIDETRPEWDRPTWVKATDESE